MSMEKKMLIYTTLLAGFLSLVVFSSFNAEDPKAVTPPDIDSAKQQFVSGFDLNKTFEFASEPMPTTYFDPVERLDRELLINAYMHASTLLHIKTANRYFPIIEPILAKHGVPEDFKYLCVACDYYVGDLFFVGAVVGDIKGSNGAMEQRSKGGTQFSILSSQFAMGNRH